MNFDEAMDIGRQAIWLILLVSLPVLLTALVIGLAISILQALTQVSEMTLTFVPKMLGVLVVALLVMPWVMSQLMDFMQRLILRIGGT